MRWIVVAYDDSEPRQTAFAEFNSIHDAYGVFLAWSEGDREATDYVQLWSMFPHRSGLCLDSRTVG